jgi:RNA polymerase sigma factor (sigma-70 family)
MEKVSGTPNSAPLRVVGASTTAGADWEAVYRNHVTALYRYVYTRTGNRPDAEDVTSTTFMRALPRLRPEVSEGEMRAYLRATARSVLADMWQERHGATTDLIDEDTMSGTWTQEPATEVDVDYVLADLPENYRQVLEFRFLRGYTIKETAAAMGVSIANAKVLQLRALRRAAAIGRQDAPS